MALGRYVVVLAVHVLGVSAAAAEPQAPGTRTSSDARVLQPWGVEVAAGIGKEVGDLWNIDRSPLVRVAFGRQIKPYLEVRGLFRYVHLGSYPEYDGSYVHLTEFDIGLGTRLSTPITPRVRLFGDLEVFHHTSRDVYTYGTPEGSSETYYNSGVGLGVRTGVLIAVVSGASVLGGFGTHWANLGGEPDALIIGWGTAECGVVLRF